MFTAYHGGYSAGETCHDLELCHEILAPGGLLALVRRSALGRARAPFETV